MHDSISSKSTPSKIDRLAADIAAAGLSQSELEGVVYRLSPAERRLFLRLVPGGSVDTIAIRRECSIGNVSECATALNQKLTAANDPRRVVCTLVRHTNAYGDPGTIGDWALRAAASC